MWTLDAPLEDTDYPREDNGHVGGASLRRSDVGGLGGDDGLQGASLRSPSLAELPDMPNNEEKEAYLREDRQDRHLRQRRIGGQRTDEMKFANSSAKYGEFGGVDDSPPRSAGECNHPLDRECEYCRYPESRYVRLRGME